MSLAQQKPTGVFVGAPARSPIAVTNTQAEGQGMPVVAFANSNMPIKAIGFVSDIFEVSDRRTEGFNIPLVCQSDAEAQIAARDAEIVRLREALDRIRLIPFPMMDLPAGIMHGIAHKALKGGAA